MSIQMQVDTQQPGPDAPPPPEANKPERPEWLPEGYEKPEDFRKAFDDLKAEKEKAGTQAQDLTDEKVTEFLTGAGFDAKELGKKIVDNGELDQETYAKLVEAVKKAGYPESLVSSYIQSKMAEGDQAVQSVYDSVGGKENYSKMADWAQETLSPEDLKDYSDFFQHGSPEQARFAAKALYSRYQNEARIPGKMLKATSQAAGGDVFQSMEQQVAAQSDARYATDPAYRKAVEEKIARSLRNGGYALR